MVNRAGHCDIIGRQNIGVKGLTVVISIIISCIKLRILCDLCNMYVLPTNNVLVTRMGDLCISVR